MNTFWMILLSMMVIAGCQASSESPATGVNNPTPGPVSSAQANSGVVTIQFDEIATYPGLELRWVEINDSRCRTGVQCVWAGEVKVILEATKSTGKNNEPVEFELTLKVRGQPATVSVLGYELELLSVQPYPANNVTTERNSYLAELKIFSPTVD
jgi:hypothetical protein